ncbi:MAG: hypothetical protein OEV30_09235 [Ignavibacteria bacterium]|nr:hypothetical protein [Ignavibacteria bacterium]
MRGQLLGFLLVTVLVCSENCSGQDYGRRDTDFTVTLTGRTEFPPGIDAFIRTTEQYPCTGYRIRAGVSWESDTLTIAIGGFVRPSPCVPLSAEATGSLYLGDIGSGSYILRIRYRSDTELHRLLINEKDVRVESGPNSFTRLFFGEGP